jgi:hypothetical protein
MVGILTWPVKNTQGNQNYLGNSGASGSNGNNKNHVEEIKNNIPGHNNTWKTRKTTPRPLLPHLLDGHGYKSWTLTSNLILCWRHRPLSLPHYI